MKGNETSWKVLRKTTMDQDCIHELYNIVNVLNAKKNGSMGRADI